MPQYAGFEVAHAAQRVYQLAGQSGFPKPVATLAQGKIWAVDEVETWIDTHRSKR